LANHPHVKVRQEAYRDHKTGDVLEYKDGTPCLVPSPEQVIGGLQYFVLGGVTLADVNDLQSRICAVGWVDQIIENESGGHDNYKFGTRTDPLDHIQWRKPKSVNRVSDGIPVGRVVASRKNNNGLAYLPKLRRVTKEKLSEFHNPSDVSRSFGGVGTLVPSYNTGQA